MTGSAMKIGLLAGALAAALAICSCKPRAEQSNELVIWQTETDPGAQAVLERVARDFEKSHPGVTVSIDSVPWGSLSEKLANAIKNDDPPDIAHLEPFMTYSLVQRGLLSPIDDVIGQIVEDNGEILPAVADLQRFDGKRYGMAYAVGVTGWTFDMRKSAGLAPPYPPNTAATISEEALFAYLRQVKARNPKARVLLPGGTPFFMEQLFGELVANAGGRLYDPASQRFLLDAKASRQALDFFVRLNREGLISDSWRGQQYVDQFARLATDDSIFLTPVTYARATVSIGKALGPEKASLARAATFRFSSPPTLRPGAAPVATIDCEPFVIFDRTARQTVPGGQTKRALAAEFLRSFYSRQNYLEFVSKVPIHLTPIFERLASDPAYLAAIKPGWREWHLHTLAFLKNRDLTRPILVPGPDSRNLEQDLRNPYLLDLQAQGVISRAIAQALEPNPNPDRILAQAQEAAMRLVQRRVEPAPKS